MDIRKFFGVINVGKKQCDTAKKNEKPKNKEGVSGEKSKSKEIKVKNLSHEEDFKPKQVNKKKRIIYDSDSEEEVQLVKKSKKSPDKKQLSKSDNILKKEPVVYVSETDEDEDFVNKKASKKPKENGTSSSICLGTSGLPKADIKPKLKCKSISPVKLTPTSVIDFFGTGTIQRSEKKLVSSKRKEPSQNRNSTLDDEAIARHLQLEENSELERQLHEDEEFARTLAMLDETPKKKKPRKDLEATQPDSTDKTGPDETEKNEDPHEASTSFESKLYSAKDQTYSESPRKLTLRQESNASAKLAALKQKSEDTKQENGTPKGDGSKKESGTAKGRTASPKEEKTPKKISPQKSKTVSPEDSEKKRTNYQAYRSYLNREGPKALGSKEIPQGGENCLEGLTFVITGVLESIERDEAKSLIERYGGKVTGNISKKTNYLVKGRDSGAAKYDKASALGTKIINEDGLFDLIRTLPGKRSKYEVAAEKEAKTLKTPQKAEADKMKTGFAKKESEPKKKLTPEKGKTINSINQESEEGKKSVDLGKGIPEPNTSKPNTSQDTESLVQVTGDNEAESLLWVDKYKPTSLKTIIGQQGDQSCANKLLRWLKNWYKNNSRHKHGDVTLQTLHRKCVLKATIQSNYWTFYTDVLTVPPMGNLLEMHRAIQTKHSKFGSKDEGTTFKAALLSGPPGVGKTTTASLVCKEVGLSYVELNASDTRSKSSLKEVVSESLNNTSITRFSSGSSLSVSKKHVLIMDEVDGMAGNEDRGGIQELIDLIKHTKVPIICMCNDRNHPKIRSLVNHCLDLRFPRPRMEQIKGAMMSIAFKEGLKIPPPAMNEIIWAANQDIRQVLHNLNMWCTESKTLTYDGVKEDANKAKKDIKLGPFDVVRKVFAAGEETSQMSLIDKSDLFFHDYSLGPLFVQENYIHVKPAAAGGNMKNHLMLLSKAADSICDGDLVDRQIRSKQNWSLLPTQAIYSSVLPGELMRGYMQQFPNFPCWLGKFSSTKKHDRIIQELSMHMSLRTQASKSAVNLDYLSYLQDAIVRPLMNLGTEGVPKAVTFMDSYCLMKEDVDNIMEVTSWNGKPSAFSQLDSKVKSAFTRTYNKEVHIKPYALHMEKRSKRRTGSGPDSELNEEQEADEVQSENEQESIENDAMIKKNTKSFRPPERKDEKKKGKAKKKSK